MKRFWVILVLFWIYHLSKANLDVFISQKEVKKILYDLSKDLYIIQNGEVAALIRNPLLPAQSPAIKPHVDRLKLHFKACAKIKYEFFLTSSDLKVMKTPTASIPLTGMVPQTAKDFRIKFPCTGVKSGQVLMTIVMQFSDQNGKEIFDQPVVMRLRRECKTEGEAAAVLPPPFPRDCSRRCDKTYMLRRFCVSDFAIRAKVEYHDIIGDRIVLHVKVMKKFKTGRVKIEYRSVLEVRGPYVGCDCDSLKIGQVYLILGKEDRRKKVLFVDNYTAALTWQRAGRRIVKTHRKKNKCPRIG